MYRVILLFSLIISGGLAAVAQPTPVKWAFSAERTGDGEYKVTCTADISGGWYLYSQHLEDGGPIPTSIAFNPAGNFSLVGETKENGAHKKEGFDEMFSMNVVKYAGKAVFTQQIRVSDASLPVEGTVTFMTCDDDQCLPPKTIPFRITLTK